MLMLNLMHTINVLYVLCIYVVYIFIYTEKQREFLDIVDFTHPNVHVRWQFVGMCEAFHTASTFAVPLAGLRRQGPAPA